MSAYEAQGRCTILKDSIRASRECSFSSLMRKIPRWDIFDTHEARLAKRFEHKRQNSTILVVPALFTG
jgi:hypothetical protein